MKCDDDRIDSAHLLQQLCLLETGFQHCCGISGVFTRKSMTRTLDGLCGCVMDEKSADLMVRAGGGEVAGGYIMSGGVCGRCIGWCCIAMPT